MNRTYDAMMQINSNLTNYETKEINKVIKKNSSKHIYKTTKCGEKYWSNLDNINKKIQIQSSGLETNEEKEGEISEEK
jgi:uncharacterized protein with PIN domain